MFHSKAKIFPVFYGVKPSDLRHIEKGMYAKVFTEYEEKRRYMEKLTDRKETLQSVSFIEGYEISGNFNISDCQNIVLAVQNEVQSKKSLHVAKYPVGLHRLVEDFERLCLDELVEDFESQCGTNEGDKEKAQVVGIFGMGGAGKTTLAKELFNRKRSQYTEACFLFDVREAYAGNSFPSLQMKLLKDLFQKDGFNFQSTEEGKTQIADCIKRSNRLSFLIVLDYIDHVEQLDALLLIDILKKFVYSLVIVTTRDVGVLINAGISAVYNVKKMGRDDATELFCWHAFGQPHPANDYENLVNSFLNVCGGLPLSHQVLGSHVHGRDQNYWSLKLNNVRKTLPRDIQQRLKISFDALDYEEQQIFMDIACFFIDKMKSTAMRVWQASGWRAQHTLETLKNKCLVQEIVGDEGLLLRMHDHLRDLGREMASALSRPSRLWRRQDLEYLESKGFQNILAQTRGRCFHSFIDESMRCQITYFVGESNVGADTSTCLLWLELWYIDFDNQRQTRLQPCIPSWVPLQNLRYIIIRNPRHKTLWQSHVQPSNLSWIPPLRLKTLPQSHVQMPNKLKELRIYDTPLKEFSVLQELSVAHLSCLEKIVLHKCYSLKTVTGISDLRKLVELDISECYTLQTIQGIDELRALESLQLSNCPELEELPYCASQTCLEKISVVSCGKLQTITSRSKLVKLVIKDCRELKTVAAICCDSKCLELQELSSVDRLSRLKCITIQSCDELQIIQGIDESPALESLRLSNCPELEELTCFERQTCLEKISIVNCGKLQSIILPPKLVKLRIEGCRELKTVAPICDHSCEKLQSIQGTDEL